MRALELLFRDVIFKNECDSSDSVVYKFSDPDGVGSGKSGWSFGISQFDTRNNSSALACLRECSFTEAELEGIVHQTVDVKPFSARLKANASIIAKYDVAQLKRCITAALNFYSDQGIPATDTGAILATADYINQYGSCGNQFALYMRKQGDKLCAGNILDFKLEHTLYGKQHPEDCKRRYRNLVIVMKANGLIVLGDV